MVFKKCISLKSAGKMAGPSFRSNNVSPSSQLAISAKLYQDLESVTRDLGEMYPARVLKNLRNLADDMNAPLEYFTNSLPALFANSLGVSVVKKTEVNIRR